ncbi:vitamin K-dependent protein Z [Mauremys reevesii]|uniref:vitamin K-dependent protein Z n=1 Tax=Mauremys reevesii TaxID=260615 RepID=UPI00193FBE7F|nr:vitamin K-dependent protein Z [Mauremys reevesii]XP_039365716.1 vitamin K-dependent protein Z [Mauremys reevesii]XP_039365722.1 vitamin K-dependent protein Z [Mauremys reevesii]
MATHFWTICFLLFVLLFLQTEQTVFLSANNANQVISRHKRGSFLIIEEFFQGNLERECLEERCTYEEAREVFEDNEDTKKFWAGYFSGRQCSSNPCQHNGVCQDSIRGYTCTCTDAYEGPNCNFAKNECQHKTREGCQHFCYPGSESYHCACAKGYELGEDKKSCIPKDQCACGRLDDVKIKKLKEFKTTCHRGFPWQVLLLNSEGKGFCGGVLLKSNFVLTTAECGLLHNHSGIRVRTGNNRMHGAGQVVDVNQKHIHMRYDEATGVNNLALLQLGEHIECNNYHHPICLPDKDFAEHVLIPQLAGTVSGWKLEESEVRGSLVELQVSYLPERECEQILNTSLTNRQYCGHHPEPVDGQLAGGNFIAHDYKGTWFLTGIFGAWPTNVSNWEPFIFAKTSRYIMWFKQKTE